MPLIFKDNLVLFNRNIKLKMKKEIHPEYHKEASVKCSCGNSFKIGSTKNEIEIEICSACHPFYTGKEKIVDTMGRVERFKKKMEKKETLARKSK